MNEAAAGPGSLALTRVTGRLLGWLTLLTSPAWLHGALDQAPAMATWWNAVALALLGTGAAASVLWGFVRPGPRWPAAVLAGAVAVLVVTWGAAVVDPVATDERLPWLWLVLPLALAAVATLDSLVVGAVYGVVVGVPYALLRLGDEGGSGEPLVAVGEGALLVAMALGLALLVRASRSAARKLDREAREAADARRDAASAAAAGEARAEVDAVVHDRVLAALAVAVASPTSPQVPVLARTGLATLEGSGERGGGPQVPAADLAARVEDAVLLLAPAARVVRRAGPPVPEQAARAVVEATAEAVRNSVRHGGHDGRRPAIRVETGAAPGEPGVLAVVVRDDGPGFDPTAVAPERLGVAVSVVGRMRTVGGTAAIESSPGDGTTVRLRWPAAGP